MCQILLETTLQNLNLKNSNSKHIAGNLSKWIIDEGINIDIFTGRSLDLVP